MSHTFHTEDLSKNTNAVTLMTYATEDELRKVILLKREYISGCAFILHDKDDNQDHHHIQLTLKRSRRLSDVIGWFKNCLDSKGQKANTLGEITLSCRAQEEYFTHSDDDSRKAGKHQYLAEDIKVLEEIGEPWDFVTAHDKQVGASQRKRETEDENEQLLQDIIDGIPMRDMARKYGRDFMKNFKAYRLFASEVVLEETGDLEVAMKLQRTAIEDFTALREKDAYRQGIRHAIDLCMERIDNGKDVTTALRILKQGVNK